MLTAVLAQIPPCPQKSSVAHSSISVWVAVVHVLDVFAERRLNCRIVVKFSGVVVKEITGTWRTRVRLRLLSI